MSLSPDRHDTRGLFEEVERLNRDGYRVLYRRNLRKEYLYCC